MNNNNLNYLKDYLFECLFKGYNGLLSFFKKLVFFTEYNLEKENIIKDIRNVFILEEDTKTIKDEILRDVKNLFEHEQEENYYKPGVKIRLHTKAIEIKHYQLNNILIKLEHI